MKRREFIKLVSGAAVWPRIAGAQQAAMPVIGYLDTASPDLSANRVRAFRQGLGEAGFEEGRNIAIEYRWADGQFDRLPALADNLARTQVSVIVGATGPAALAAKAATSTIPIVFQIGVDPVRDGLVSSLNRPGGNVTGVTNLSAELQLKRLELLHELLPRVPFIAILVNPTDSLNLAIQELEVAARTLGITTQILHASSESEFDAVFRNLASARAGLIITGAFFANRSKQLAELTVRHSVPSTSQDRDFAAAGGLMSYGNNPLDSFRQVGVYTGRILKGEKPANLPVQQPTKVELILNLKTAKTLGITIPLPLLGRADEVIE